MTRNGEGYFLTSSGMQMSWSLYTPDVATA